jgi:hypothetical protein
LGWGPAKEFHRSSSVPDSEISLSCPLSHLRTEYCNVRPPPQRAGSAGSFGFFGLSGFSGFFSSMNETIQTNRLHPHPSPLKPNVSPFTSPKEWGAFSRTSQSDPLGRRRVETFWNSRGQGLATLVSWSVPAFLPGSASADTSLLRSWSRSPKASLWRGVISR